MLSQPFTRNYNGPGSDGVQVRASLPVRHQRAECTRDQAETLAESDMWSVTQKTCLERWKECVAPV
jgi:hypothetical protein